MLRAKTSTHMPKINLVAGKPSSEKLLKKPNAELASGPGRRLPQ
jgi:hypothetical protein